MHIGGTLALTTHDVNCCFVMVCPACALTSLYHGLVALKKLQCRESWNNTCLWHVSYAVQRRGMPSGGFTFIQTNVRHELPLAPKLCGECPLRKENEKQVENTTWNCLTKKQEHVEHAFGTLNMLGGHISNRTMFQLKCFHCTCWFSAHVCLYIALSIVFRALLFFIVLPLSSLVCMQLIIACATWLDGCISNWKPHHSPNTLSQ